MKYGTILVLHFWIPKPWDSCFFFNFGHVAHCSNSSSSLHISTVLTATHGKSLQWKIMSKRSIQALWMRLFCKLAILLFASLPPKQSNFWPSPTPNQSETPPKHYKICAQGYSFEKRGVGETFKFSSSFSCFNWQSIPMLRSAFSHVTLSPHPKCLEDNSKQSVKSAGKGIAFKMDWNG